MKKIIVIGLVVLSLLLVACSPKLSQDELNFQADVQGKDTTGSNAVAGRADFILTSYTGCTETGDVGKDYYTKGVIFTKYGTTPVTFSDRCYSSTTLYEYYCTPDTNKPARAAYTCPLGCDTAVAVCKQACTDADTDGYGATGTYLGLCTASTTVADCNDANANVKPGAVETCNGVDDNCVTGVDEGLSTTGTSACCSGTTVDTTTSTSNCGACGTICTSGKVCQNGACVSLAGTCTDSDNDGTGAQNYATRGTVTLNGTSTYGTDSCTSTIALREVQCYDTGLSWKGMSGKATSYDCSTVGKTCQNGACVQALFFLIFFF